MCNDFVSSATATSSTLTSLFLFYSLSSLSYCWSSYNNPVAIQLPVLHEKFIVSFTYFDTTFSSIPINVSCTRPIFSDGPCGAYYAVLLILYLFLPSIATSSFIRSRSGRAVSIFVCSFSGLFSNFWLDTLVSFSKFHAPYPLSSNFWPFRSSPFTLYVKKGKYKFEVSDWL